MDFAISWSSAQLFPSNLVHMYPYDFILFHHAHISITLWCSSLINGTCKHMQMVCSYFMIDVHPTNIYASSYMWAFVSLLLWWMLVYQVCQFVKIRMSYITQCLNKLQKMFEAILVINHTPAALCSTIWMSNMLIHPAMPVNFLFTRWYLNDGYNTCLQISTIHLHREPAQLHDP